MRFNFNSIKTVIRLFFFLNIGLVIFNYVLTYISNNASQEDRKYVEVSKENESYVERLKFITKAIVKGGEIEQKTVLKTEIEKYNSNLDALKNTGDASISDGKEIIKITRPSKNRKELDDLILAWTELKTQLQTIIDKPIEIDTAIIQDTQQAPIESTVETAKEDELDSLLAQTEVADSSQKVIQTLRPTSDLETISFATLLNPEVEKIYYMSEASLDEVLNKNRELSKIYESNYTDSQVFLGTVLFWTFLANLFILIGGTFVIGGFFINPLKKIATTAKDVAGGNINTKVEYKRQNEIGEVADSLNLIVGSFKQYTDFAENIGKGNFESNFDVKSENDILGYALLSMRDNLKRIDEEDNKRNWTNEGFALFSNILRSTDKAIEDFCYDIVSNLVKYVHANQGGIFLMVGEDNERFLELKATFAFDKRKFEDKIVQIGQGLIGQAVLEKDIIYLDKVPDDYIKITSGLGGSNPRCLLVIPLKVNQEVHGVIEIASFNLFEKYEIDFIQKLSENIASTLATVKINENTKRLLEETQQYAEQMQAQEEEMRQNMEELASTQEEMQKNQSKLEDYKENLEKEVENRTAMLKEKETELSNALSQLQGIIESSKSGVVALNTDYRIVAANQRLREIIRLLRSSEFEIGDNWFKIFKNEEDLVRAKRFWDEAMTGKSFNVEDKFGDNPSSRRWYDVSFNPIQTEEKVIIGASMFIRDITDRKVGQKNVELMAQILDDSSNEVYVFNSKDLKFTLVNERGRDNLGYSMEELSKLDFCEVESKFNLDTFGEFIQPLLRKEVTNIFLETGYKRKDGSSYEVEMSLQLFEDEESVYLAAIAQDVTLRKQNELELKEAVERFDLATKATKEGLWEMNVNPDEPLNPDNKVWWSQQYKTLLGYEDGEFEEKLASWISCIHPDDREKITRTMHEHIVDRTGQTPFDTEYRLLHKDNDYIWFSAIAETLRDEKGLPTRVAGSIRNINRRKKAEQDLILQTATVNGILSAAVNSIISFNKDGAIFSANHSSEKIFGYTPEELIGENVDILLEEEKMMDIIQNIDTVKEVKGKKKDGSAIPVDVSVSETKVGDGRFFVGIFRDTSDFKEREHKLSESEERLRKMTESTLEGIFFHENGIITDVNESFTKLTGYEAKEIVGKEAFMMLTPESRNIALQKSNSNDETTYIIDLIKKNQEIIPMEVTAREVRRNGTFLRVVSLRDISERLKAEKTQQILIEILNTLPDFVCYTNEQGLIRYMNKSGAEMLGYDNKEAILNHHLSDIYPSWALDLYEREWLPTGLQYGRWEGAAKLKKQNGEEIDIKLMLIPHLNREGRLEYTSHIITK